MKFDQDVQVGEIRIFADAKEPLTALVLRDCGLSGFRLVPVSPYRVPVSDREIAVGERVFQVWNVCTAARRFVERSWRVDVLRLSDLETIRLAVAEFGALPPKLGDYERRQLAQGGDFGPWADKLPAEVSFWRQAGGWSIAAAVVVGLGVTWMLMRPELVERPTARVMTVQLAREEAVPELEEAVSDENPAEDADAVLMTETKVEVSFPKAKRALVEPAPEVQKVAAAPKMAPSVSVRKAAVRRDAVVASKARAGAREVEVIRMLEELKGAQREDGSWGAKPLRDTALSVIALMAHGETSSSAAFGRTLVDGVRWLTEAKLDGAKREDIQIAACALCCASVAVRNPNVRVAAERTLASIGDNRSVEAGRDWRGLLVDLQTSAASRGNRVASEHSDGDAVADSCVLILQLLK